MSDGERHERSKGKKEILFDQHVVEAESKLASWRIALMDRIIEARLDALGKRIMDSPPDERGRVGIVIDASIPACSENEAQLMAQELQAYRSGTKFYCFGVSRGCDGELEGSSHSPHCPMYVGSGPAELTLENVESYDPKDSGNQAS